MQIFKMSTEKHFQNKQHICDIYLAGRILLLGVMGVVIDLEFEFSVFSGTPYWKLWSPVRVLVQM